VDAPFAAFNEFEVLHRVGQVELAPVEARVFERAVKQVTGRADEWMPVQIFLVTGLFADEDYLSADRPLAEYRLRGTPIQLTPPTST
jgi:hypothetical protein